MPSVISSARGILPEWIRRPLRSLRWRVRAEFRTLDAALGRAQPAVYAIGDSHAKYNFGADPRIRVRHLGPVTMYRIARDGRKAVSLKELGVVQGDIVIWCLGAIDVSNHLIKQRDVQGIPVEEVIDSLARKYLQSVATIQEEIGDVTMLILAVIPPTDQGERTEIPIAGSLEERVNARTSLNAVLKRYSLERGFNFLDPYGPFTDSTGVLKPEMSDGSVHCGPSFAPLIVQQVMGAVAPWRKYPST
jgi:hypothetical protein